MTPKRLSEFFNRHQQASVVVCGCGPSLLQLRQPVEALTIGVNDVGRLFDPTYLVVVDPPRQFQGDRFAYVESSRAKVIFTPRNLRLQHPCVVRFKLGQRGGTDFSNPDELPCGRTSPYVAVCLAAYMGAARIGLIGVDFTEGRFFGPTGPHPLAAKLQTIDREFGRLAEALAGGGVELVNLSPQSRLKSLPKASCDAFLRRSKSARGDPSNRPSSRKRKPAARGRLRVVHVATTNCAGALWNLHRILNRYSHVQSRVVTASQTTGGRLFPKDVLLSEQDQVAQLLEEADLLHFHNWIDAQSRPMAPFRKILQGKPAVLQFHSEPALLERSFPDRDPCTRSDLLTLVVAQKHARFYPRAVPVPNAVDIHDPLLKPRRENEEGPLRVLYTPTDTDAYPDYSNICRGKGYRRTQETLRELQQKGLIEAVIRTGVPWKELMNLRRESHAVVDECVTGGYHLTSLEGLSQGLATVAFLDEETRALLCELTGCPPWRLPWVNTPQERLRETLIFLAENLFLLRACRSAARSWMERFWHPDFIVGHYLRAYRRAIDGLRAAQRVSTAASIQPREGESERPPPGIREVHRQIPGRPNPRRSEDFPQTVRLGSRLLSRRGSLSGEPCHVLANGPSIRALDLSLLGSRTAIGVNASPLLREALGRDLDYYCVSDRRFLQDEDSRKLAQSAKSSVRVFAGYCCGFLSDRDIHYVRILAGDGICADLEEGFHHCCSVALFAAQLALWLGCGDLFLHGCEFDYRDGRFCKDSRRPHDRGIYPRVSENAKRLSEELQKRGRRLHVVGPSRLTGDFGWPPVAGIRRISISEMERVLGSANSQFAVR